MSRTDTIIQLILHLIGDYVTQSDWMANGKIKRTFPALVHACVYSAPFLFIGSWKAVAFIAATHFLMDRFRLAKYIVFAKNFMGWPWPKWDDCKANGYPSACPIWMSTWLMIVADNTVHLLCNYIALEVWK